MVISEGSYHGHDVSFGCFSTYSFLTYSSKLDGEYTPFGFEANIPQPNPKQPFEWKIKHIKADDYKCGRDVALTILYKDIGDGYYEYKYAICSPKEMFSRNEGIKEALKKPDTWKVYVGNYKERSTLQVIAWNLPFTARLSDEVVHLLLSQGFYNS